LRLIMRVNTPPRVSMPSERGVTSSSRMSFTSPRRTPPLGGEGGVEGGVQVCVGTCIHVHRVRGPARVTACNTPFK
jgi:hypothetical protein